LKLSDKVVKVLKEIFLRGQGRANKGAQSSPEGAIMELHAREILRCAWDQRLAATRSKVKGFFRTMKQGEEAENDANHEANRTPQVTDDDIIQRHREVADELSGENSQCEERLMKEAGIQLDSYRPEDFETMDLKYFSK
jgi:hypothetical protein